MSLLNWFNFGVMPWPFNIFQVIPDTDIYLSMLYLGKPPRVSEPLRSTLTLTRKAFNYPKKGNGPENDFITKKPYMEVCTTP